MLSQFTPKKFKFYIVVDPVHKFLVPMAPNKTVGDLIEEVKVRLRKKCSIASSNHNPSIKRQQHNKPPEPPNTRHCQLDIDALSTMYWVDAQSLKPQHVYVILQATDRLQKILHVYRAEITNKVKIKQFYWYITASPTSVLRIANLKPMEIAQPPNEIRQKYHRNTPFLYPGFYFNFFIAKKYHGPNHQEKRKQIELYRQQRLQTKYHLNSPIPKNHMKTQHNTSYTMCNKETITNNRGRFVTANAMNEIRHHRQHNTCQNTDTQQIEDSKTMKGNASNRNELHFFPKQSMISDVNNTIAYTQTSQRIQHVPKTDHIFYNTSNNEFNDIPSYLLDDMDHNWSYLYHSFDFKYLLVLCFACRCLNGGGNLSQAQYVKLGESAKLRQLTDEEFDICIQKSVGLNCTHLKETINILAKQNDNYYINFERMIVYDCLVHLVSDGFEDKRLQILRICSQFGTVNELSPLEIGCIIQMYQTESQLLNVYRHLF
eukprot:588930_1